MYYEDPETGERKPYVDLMLLHGARVIPGLRHLPDWMHCDLIEKDPQLIRAYLRDPANETIRRNLSTRIIVRIQSELDNVATQRRLREEQRLAEARTLYRMRWAIDQMQAILTSKVIHKAFSKHEYQALQDRHDELHQQREDFVRKRPRWSRELGMDRWDAQRLERVLFEERQAIERMEAGLPAPQES
jgi:hypothetical protein